jgi:imidazolonepropionase-like amidohydrolase
MSSSPRIALLALSALVAGAPRALDAQTVSLAIRHATLFDSEHATTRAHVTVLVDSGRIVAVGDDRLARRRAITEIDAHGRLLIPGLIDVHHHVAYTFPDSITPGGGAISRLVMQPDSIAAYRGRWAAQFLPYGVTAVREVGGDDRYLPLMVAWMQASPSAPDIFPSGGALVSEEPGRIPFRGHAVVRDSADAVRVVQRYHAAGLRDVKLYWRLREPEFSAALREANRLGMHVTAHIDFGVMSIERAMELGLRHFEHAYTLGVEALPGDRITAAWRAARDSVLLGRPDGAFYMGVLEHFIALGPNDTAMARLIEELARTHSTVTPTLHIFAERLGLTYFTTPSLGAFDNSARWTPAQVAHARRGYAILEQYVRRLHEARVPLAVGTDWLEPGKAVLSEILLLHRAGIPMAEVLRIATLESARTMERGSEYGVIALGRKADLVLFDASPLDDPAGLLGGRTVIKDGVVSIGARLSALGSR